MDLKPLPGKVLIAPDLPPDVTESGIVLVDHWPQEVSGTVVAVGDAKHPRKDEAFRVAELIDCEEDDCKCLCHQSAVLLRELTGREPAVAVGDRVVFAPTAGQDVRINDTRYLLLTERDLLAVLEGAA